MTSLVRQAIETAEDESNYDGLVGWKSGINSCLQDKSWCQANICNFERQCNRNTIYPRVYLVIHYLSQEENYSQNYPQEGETFDVGINHFLGRVR